MSRLRKITIGTMIEDKELNIMEARANRATKGPWSTFADGNQYKDTIYMSTAKLVAAYKIPEIVRPWNPHAYLSFGFTPKEFETARFIEEDAEFIAHARQDVPALIAEIRRIKNK